jgi:hypothetical protein
MKKIALHFLLLVAFAASYAQAGNSKKSIDYILEVYERTAPKYIENRIHNATNLFPQNDSTKEIAIVMRLYIKDTIKSINEETREKFKDELQNVSNLQAVKDFIDYRYKIDIGGLTDEFYKKVAEELAKS